MKPKNYQVTEIELYLSEVGDGDPDLQFTPQEEYVMHQRCLGRWTAYNEAVSYTHLTLPTTPYV